MPGYFDRFAKDYDRIQPVKIEMYRFYHQLALDLVPFEPDSSFRVADLGCGTGTFLGMLVERFPKAKAIAIDLHNDMLEESEKKLSDNQVEFVRHDLNDPLPDATSNMDLIVAFSSLHHLSDERKESIVHEIHRALKPGGYLLIADAMYVSYSEQVWSRGRVREQVARSKRFADAGIEQNELHSHEHAKQALEAESPERDRISTLQSQLTNLREAGFSQVDHVWHFFMEHLLIARK